MTTLTQIEWTKEIGRPTYNRETRELEFPMYFAKEFVGYARSHLQAEEYLNELAYQQLTRGQR